MLINQSNTAIHCFHENVPNIRRGQKRRIFDAVNNHVDMTIGEISKETGIDKSMVSARRNEMLSEKVIKRGLLRKCCVSGVMCETVLVLDK
jgi:hypothetical protein